MLNINQKPISAKVKVGIKGHFDSASSKDDKFLLETVVGNKEKGKFKTQASIKLALDIVDQLSYKDFMDFFAKEDNIITKIPDIVKEISWQSKGKYSIYSALKTSEKSIKSFINIKDSILDHLSGFDNNKEVNIIGLRIQKKKDSVSVGLIDILNEKGFFFALTKEIPSIETYMNVALEKWAKEDNILLAISTLCDSIGAKVKSKAYKLENFSKMQYSFVLEPLKILKILLWNWIKEFPERRYLIAFLKQVVFRIVFSYENNKLSFNFLIGLKNSLQLDVKRGEKNSLTLRKFEMEQTIYKN